MAIAIATNLSVIFTRAREMTVTDAETHLITKKLTGQLAALHSSY